ncbi:MAG TPA: DNA repair exonuclease [Schlesneria sp.]|jgi:DNA repair exonuclease SbcCD nuclease subunit
MKFIHAADIHLDSPLRGLEKYEGAPVHKLRGATRRALENLINLCLEEQVDFLVIAGDLYDGDWNDYSTGLFFSKQMSLLREAGVKVFLVRGNHDASSQITSQLTLPDNVTVFSSGNAESITLEDFGAVIHGQSFGTRAVKSDLSAKYPLAVDGYFNIGILHTSADGREGHENYAPCTVAGMLSRGYQYWALGHVHKREEIHRDPWIVFPGNIQGRHARECGVKGCSLVTVANNRVISVEPRPLDVVRWCECILNIDAAEDVNEVLEQARLTLSTESDAAEGRMIAARIIIQGTSNVHRLLVSEHEQFVNECRALANDVGSGVVWIERVLIKTRMPLDLEELIKREDPLGDLIRFTRSLPENTQLLSELANQFKAIQQKLPLDLRRGEESLAFDTPDVISQMLPDVEQLLLSKLIETEVIS